MKPTRRVVAGLTGAAFVLMGVGIAAMVFGAGFAGGARTATGRAGMSMPRPTSPGTGAGQTASPSVSSGGGTPGTPTPVVSASPTVVSSPSAHPVGFVQRGAELIYAAADGSVVPVPPMNGLRIEVKGGKANYYALSSNAYGLATGAYAGEFMPLVATGQVDGSSAETGGVVLVGRVVSKLISDELASIKAPGDRWIVALPIDIRSSPAAMVQVSFDQFGLAGWTGSPRVYVGFGGSLPIVEAIPANGGYHILVEGLGPTTWQVIDPVRLGLPSDSIDPDRAMNELLVYGNGTASLKGAPIARDIHHDGRVGVGTPMVYATGGVSVSLVVAGSHADLGPDKVLMIGDVPVFVASS
jgi:hypothetical protein